MTIEELKDKAKSAVLLHRKILRLVISESFTAVYKRGSEEARTKFDALFNDRKYAEMTQWLREQDDLEHWELPIRKLRKVARSAGVKYYNRKTKAELLSDLAYLRQHNGTETKPAAECPRDSAIAQQSNFQSQ
jgi:hypothetical protein